MIMGLFTSKNAGKNAGKNNRGGHGRDEGELKWSFWSSGSGKGGAKAVDRERRQQNPNGFSRKGKW